ncbi:MAG: glycosyltransferase [Lachnospiraceae bacterium]
MAKISVIVPVYNVESYIHRCVDSIREQTFSDFEIILVNDGTTDTSDAICDWYAKEDQRIHVVHKENGGLSDARNTGLALATGDYIAFVDSDDYIDRNMLNYLYCNITDSQADVATCGICDVYEDREDRQEELPVFVCNSEKAYECLMQGHTIRGEVCNKLLRRTSIEGLQFPVGKIYEDIFFTADLMRRIHTVCVGTKAMYYYVHREGSITRKSYHSQMKNIIEGYTHNYKVVRRYFPALEKEGECLWLWSRFIVLDRMMLMDNYKEIEGYQELILFIKNHIGNIMHNPYFIFKRKVAAMLLFVNTKLYRQLVCLSERRKQGIKEEK